MSHRGSLAGKIVVVTGAGGVIGSAICSALASREAAIACVDLDIAKAADTVERLAKQGATAHAFEHDVADWQAARPTLKRVHAEMGGIHGLVNNAGVYFASKIGELEEKSHRWLFDINLHGAFALTTAIVPYLVEQREGKIVNVASIAGRDASPFGASYAASKAGLIALTKSVSKELGPYDINVNCVCPGSIWTPMTIAATRQNEANLNQSAEEQKARRIAMTPLQRLSDPGDVGEAVAFLCSDASRNITGQSVNVCGGSQMI